MANPGNCYTKFYSTFTTMRRKHRWKNSGGALLGLSLTSFLQTPDEVNPESKTIKEFADRQTTGWERLRIMFSYDDFGNMSPELAMVSQGTMFSVLTGTMIGGTIHSKESFVKFIEENQGTAFQNTFDAKKQLQNKVTIGFVRGAWMWGWRMGMFCGSFLLFTSAIATYRGKSSLLEYVVGGAASGTIFKFKQGPKAMVAGGVFGTALGTLAGVASLAIMYLTGTTMEELRYWQYKWKEDKDQARLEALRAARTKDSDLLTQAHEVSTPEEEQVLASIQAEDTNTSKN